MKKENCEHKWVEVEKKNVIKDIFRGLITDTYTYEIRILQKCERCGLLNVVNF